MSQKYWFYSLHLEARVLSYALLHVIQYTQGMCSRELQYTYQLLVVIISAETLHDIIYLSTHTHQGLSCNLLQELPSSFCDLKSLQRVDLHRNELKDLPEGTLPLSLSLLSLSLSLDLIAISL